MLLTFNPATVSSVSKDEAEPKDAHKPPSSAPSVSQSVPASVPQGVPASVLSAAPGVSSLQKQYQAEMVQMEQQMKQQVLNLSLKTSHNSVVISVDLGESLWHQERHLAIVALSHQKKSQVTLTL